jgi:hypothetical protein
MRWAHCDTIHMSSIGQRWRDLVDAGDTRAAAERKLSKAVNDETGIDGQGARW